MRSAISNVSASTGRRASRSRRLAGHAAVLLVVALLFSGCGPLWGWGNNFRGQIGDGSNTDRLEPVPISQDWSTLAAGIYHTVGIRTDGTLWAWGDDTCGGLGDGTIFERHVPTQIGTNTHWRTVAVGYWYTVAIRTDGTLWGWGYNGNGQLGDGTTTERHVPTQIGT